MHTLGNLNRDDDSALEALETQLSAPDSGKHSPEADAAIPMDGYEANALRAVIRGRSRMIDRLNHPAS